MLPGKALKPEDLWQMARRRWRIVCIPFLLIFVATAFVVRRLPDRYRSETLILVVPQRVPESYVRSTVTARIQDRLRSINQQIMSRTRLEPIVREFGLYPVEMQTGLMEDVIERMRRDIGVRIVRGDSFYISYTSESRQTAMKVTERLASLYINENLRDREVLADGTSQFLDSQLAAARERLLEHEKKLEEYKRSYAGQLPNQVQSNLQAIQNVQLQIQALVDSTSRDRDRRLSLESTLADALAGASQAPRASADEPAAATAPPRPGTAAARLEAATKSLEAMRLRLKPKHPDIVRAERVVAELQKKADEEAAGTSNAVSAPDRAETARLARIDQLRTEIENLSRQIVQKEGNEARLRDVVATYQSRVEAVPTRESELVELTRDYETLHRSYTSLLAKKEDAQVAANLERYQIGEQFKILDPARLPERPVNVDRNRYYMLGAAAGLGLGLLLAAFLEFRDTTFKTEADVIMSLTMPVLALVPELSTPQQLRRKRRRQRLASWATAGTLAAVAMALFWVFRA